MIEYSFVEPPMEGTTQMSPSIHFRHRNRANIAWADGHVTPERFGWTYPTPTAYGANNAAMHLGYVGARDNSMYCRE